jgi:queuine tRNA-ribosyltransferase
MTITNQMPFNFKITKQDAKSLARLGELHTPHGMVLTPAFIFCATKAAIKGITPHMMKELGTQIILSNTYHLMLQPGGELVEKMGGLQQFTGWNGPMLTDSGGFQIFSLGHGSVASEIKGKRLGGRKKTLLEISEEGAVFKSYIDGRLHKLTPEKSIDIQHQLGADLIVVLDECTPYHVDKKYTETSLEMSHRWGVRSLRQFEKLEIQNQQLYGIIQGGVYEDLRMRAADYAMENPFFGIAVGGSLGANKVQMEAVVSFTMNYLKTSRPVHLLGIGGVRDIFEGVKNGIDTFDCVHPTRLARHGGALVNREFWTYNDGKGGEYITLKAAQYKQDPDPIDQRCACPTCKTYSRAYLHHLIKAKELLALQLLSAHNIYFMNHLMASIRLALREDRLDEERKKWIE